MMMSRLAGEIKNGHHELAIRIYYEDTDFSGFVYHANYLKFCERGRSDFLRLVGVHHHELHGEHAGTGFVVRHMSCDFLKPARIDDIVTVITRLVSAKGARMELVQEIRRGDEVLFSARVTAALIDGKGRPKRFPAQMLAAFSGLVA